MLSNLWTVHLCEYLLRDADMTDVEYLFVFKTLLHSDKYALHLLQYSKHFVLSPQFLYVLIVNVRTDKKFG